MRLTMYNRRAPRRQVRGVAAALLCGGLALAGCTQPAEASHLPTPGVVWENGEPTGAEWDSEWATAFRDAQIQWAAASAFADFSDPDVVGALGYDSAVSEAQTAAKYRFESGSAQYSLYELDGEYAFWGGIVDVTESADGQSAIVNGCAAALERGRDIVPHSQVFEVTRLGSGRYLVDRQSGDAGTPSCDTATIWVAKWEKPIDLAAVGRKSVKSPLPRDYYVKLGVVAESP